MKWHDFIQPLRFLYIVCAIMCQHVLKYAEKFSLTCDNIDALVRGTTVDYLFFWTVLPGHEVCQAHPSGTLSCSCNYNKTSILYKSLKISFNNTYNDKWFLRAFCETWTVTPDHVRQPVKLHDALPGGPQISTNLLVDWRAVFRAWACSSLAAGNVCEIIRMLEFSVYSE